MTRTRMFRTVNRLSYGYDPDQVDTFFEHARRAYEGDATEPITDADVRHAAFDLVRGGYVTNSVDAALDRLERAFAARTRGQFVAAHGQHAWMEHVAAQARTLYERLRRPNGERFAPARRGEQAYAAADVDALCHRLVEYFDKGTPLTSDEIRHATFSRARGHAGYAEGPVDAFFERAVEVLLGVE
jgi:DivIVA domain-containing protein